MPRYGSYPSGTPAQLTDKIVAYRAANPVGSQDVTLTPSDLYAAGYLPHNAIINPCMDVSQRNGGNQVALTTAIAYGGPDRWGAAQGTSAVGGFVQQFGPISTPVGMRSALRIGRTAGATNVNNLFMGQALETVDSVRYAGKTCEFSFLCATGAQFSGAGIVPYVACGQGVDQGLNLQVFTGWTTQTVLLNSVQAAAAGQSIATRYKFQVAVPAATTQLAFVIYYTPSGTAGADDSMYVTDVRFYESGFGDIANFGLYRPIGQELALCQRYYEKSYDQGVFPGTNNLDGMVTAIAPATTSVTGTRWRVEKRVAPTVTLYARAGASGVIDNYVTVANTGAAAAGAPGTTGMHRVDVTGGGLTAGAVYEYHFTADAEL